MKVVISHEKSVKRIRYEEVAAGGMTIQAVGEWSSLVGAARIGVLVSPRLHALEKGDLLTEVTMHMKEGEEALFHEKVPSQREEEPIPEESPTQEGEAPILGEASILMINMASSPRLWSL
ncbi:uncharacterized protein A4U43_C04F29720 [Asparagus officinalis]|uniref:Uncharacterized protein n=1 Tax=Asparagus officinalis TaxID=4686 RepID=A0A5P1F9K2_ASPOF|nr:uncharacterized protein A4U43_C04F29720 [Asparagus officinalis]